MRAVSTNRAPTVRRHEDGNGAHDSEIGSALVWALMFVVVTSGLVYSHTTYMSANRRELAARHNKEVLARTFARSGLTDALSWFRRQSDQPVVQFAPVLDTVSNPPVMDTLDPTLGLVREFEVRGSMWGRYEVLRQEVSDISQERGQTTAGTVWDLAARGILYKLVDPTIPFDQAPNRVIAVNKVRTEIRGVPVRPPAPAAIAVGAPGDVTILSNTRVVGGDKPAFAYSQEGLDAATQEVLDALPAETLEGVPGTVGVINYDDSPTRLFGMRLDQLQAFGDVSVANLEALPQNIEDYRIVFYEGDLTLPAGRNQTGQALLVVHGDLAAEADNGTQMQGMVYVTGNAALRGAFQLDGTLVVGGNLELGGGFDTAMVRYDAAVMAELREKVSAYRLSRVERSVEHGGESPGSNAKPVVGPNSTIDPSVSMGQHVVIGSDSTIKRNAVIGDGSEIGDFVIIDQNAFVGTNVMIGDSAAIKLNVIIHNNAVIGSGAVLARDVVIGAGATIAPGTTVGIGTVVPAGTNYGG